MRILLPPSETKVSGGGSSSLILGALADDTALRHARKLVLRALETLCSGTDPSAEDAAATVLQLGVRARIEIAHNRSLFSSPTMPAIERYTGVLYDALSTKGLEASSRDWLDGHVSIQSALFGLISAGNLIPAYRLSASSKLFLEGDAGGGAGLPAAKPTSLKSVWREAHTALPWAGASLIVDLRSKDYAALAPVPESVHGVVITVAQRTADGRTRALNHFNKQAKGDFVRRLAVSEADISHVAELIDWAQEYGLDLLPGSTPRELTLVTDLGAARIS
jgi:cytoplasmic iron level regulating protein YaaA (DUF328/UPF0246 family)